MFTILNIIPLPDLEIEQMILKLEHGTGITNIYVHVR